MTVSPKAMKSRARSVISSRRSFQACSSDQRASAAAMAAQVPTELPRPGSSSTTWTPALVRAAMARRKPWRTSSSSAAKPRSSETTTRSRPGSRRRMVEAVELDRVAVPRIRAGEGPEDEARVGHRPGQRPDRDQGPPRVGARLAGDGPEGRLEADDPAERGRDADGAAAVAAHADRADTGGDGRTGAAGRPTRVPAQGPRDWTCDRGPATRRCPCSRTRARRSWRR